MAINSRSTFLRLFILIYACIYGLLFILPMLTSQDVIEKMTPTESSTVIPVFVLLILGCAYAWISERISGILLLFWHFVVWAFSLTLWPDAGMVLFLVFPVLFPAILMIRNWYITNDASFLTNRARVWKLTLGIFLLNYTAIYVLVLSVHLSPTLFDWNLPTRVNDLVTWSYSSVLGILLIGTAALYTAALLAAQRSSLAAGILFITWYFGIAVLTISYPEFARSGPWWVFGISMLVQGILYLVYHYQIKADHHLVKKNLTRQF